MKVAVRQAIQKELAAVRAIADNAEVEGRQNLSAKERHQAEDHLAKARELKKTADEEDALRTQLHEMTDGLGLFPGAGSTSDSYTPAGAKTAGPGWGAKVLSQYSDGVRFKGLVGSTTTLVNVPAPPAISMGVPATSVRQLIPAEPSTGVFAYLRQTTRTSAAAPVPKGGLKPTTVLGLTRVEGSCVTVAHVSEGLNRNDISDAPLLMAWVDGELRLGLEKSIEVEILTGDDTGEHFDGLTHAAGTTPVSWVGSASDGLGVIATCRRSITTLELLGYDVDGFILNPVDWERAEMAAGTTGELVLANAGAPVPIDTAAKRLFGRPVVTSVAMPAGTGIAAQFATATRLYVREEAVVAISENVYDPDALGVGVGASDFVRNIVRARCECRMNLGILQPAGVGKLDLTA